MVWCIHWVVLVGKVTVPVVLGAAAFLGSWFASNRILLRLALMLLSILIFGVWTWVQYQNWANDMYAVDDSNLYDITKGILSISAEEEVTPLNRIQNVEV